MTTTITWSKNADNQFLVESRSHLLQIMNKGSLYTDAGDSPNNYWDASYVQTADIDLANDHTNILPIGTNSSDKFKGDYDGAHFQIMNWSYTGDGGNKGLFGTTDGSVVKNMRLSGVWTVDATGSNTCGFLSGNFTRTTVTDIECDFAEGTVVTGVGLDGGMIGGVVGQIDLGSTVQGVTLRGTVDFDVKKTSYLGGISGRIRKASVFVSHCRNLASFPNGIKTTLSAGGICGSLTGETTFNGILTTCLNAMVGDIEGENAGGIVGFAATGFDYIDLFVNSMTGTITGSTNAGGIIGRAKTYNADQNINGSKFLNYMRGDVLAGTSAGGILGYAEKDGDTGVITVTKSVMAMHGSVSDAVLGSASFTPTATEVEVTVNTEFGALFDTNDYGIATMVVDDALVYHPDFPDLPCLALDVTDADGNVYDWDFVYANLGGKFHHYTHLSLHTAQVSTPYRTDFGLAEGNNVVYLTYANADTDSLYINSSLTISETTATFAFDYDKSAILYGTADPAQTLAWTKNVDNKFEISSVQHLLQLMNNGSKYTDLGDHPYDYWQASYVQTTDIDLANDHASITPIGDSEGMYFGGKYDGNLHQIKNWEHSRNPEKDYAGLFGYCAGATLEHIRLSGIWSILGNHCGFLGGFVTASSTVHDIEGDFSEGTNFSIFNFSSLKGGCLIGQLSNSTLHGATVSGSVNVLDSNLNYIGGVLGYCLESNATQCRNIATFPNGLRGHVSGGIVAGLEKSTLTNCLNAMKGDIRDGAFMAGIVGGLVYACTMENLVNSMSGNIITEQFGGGIVGQMNFWDDVTVSKVLNYMRGDIVPTGNYATGGLVGKTKNSASYLSITKSIVAMHGSVTNAVRGVEDDSWSPGHITVDTSFGMTYSGDNDYAQATMVVDDALVYHPDFEELPYFVLNDTDADGNVYDWDFVYANLGGKFQRYTHLSVHTAQVSTPYRTDFGLAEGNSVVYLTYANADTESLYINPSLTISETTATLAFDHAKSAVVYGTPDPAETLTWTKNVDNEFEISSEQHLLQLMNQGSLYTDLGDHPYDYWQASYVQTTDIDLANDHANISPIGTDVSNEFKGEYDGAHFQIMNWSFTGTGLWKGLFGATDGAVVKNMRLSGVWTFDATDSGYCGFLSGTFTRSTVTDIECDFAEGTVVTGDGIDGGHLGGVVGMIDLGSTVQGVTLRGTVDFDVKKTIYLGGICGKIRKADVFVSHCRNLASFPNGIKTTVSAGGICGKLNGQTTFNGILTTCLNAMVGDIEGDDAGGIVGVAQTGFDYIDLLVNSMTGTITGSLNAGGIIGRAETFEVHQNINGSKFLNYMRGDVLAGNNAGGILGYANKDGDTGIITVTKSVMAMHGSVSGAVLGGESFTPTAGEVEVTVNTDFGAVFDTNDHGIATMVVDDALVYHPDFPDLPYFELGMYEWDFVYANLGGKVDSNYTHMSVHTSPSISAPLPTTVGSLVADTVYVAYANVVDQSMYIDAALSIVDTEAAVVFDSEKTQVMFGTPTPAETLVWTTDADGKFEVATKQHLLQLMQKGALYTDLGDRPTNALSYWTHHYVQTATIDFAGDDLTNIVRIGDETTTFLGSYEENGFEILNWRGPGVGDDESLFGAYTTLEWTTNAEGQHEVATAEHLVQIMQRGLLYYDEGNAPADHWSASYIQTADIDLSAHHAKIVPIGNAVTSFTGQYDGGHFKISNWSYTQPADGATVTSTGLFGAVTNAEIRRVCLSGVWTLTGSDHVSAYLGDGFLCGSTIDSTVYDISLDLSEGTLMSGGPTVNAPVTHRVGCAVGYVTNSVIFGATVRGKIEMKNYVADGHSVHVGGVVGYVVNAGSNISFCRNLGIFPSGITGKSAGGIVGFLQHGTLEYCTNAMQGNVEGGVYGGGICGVQYTGGQCNVLSNAMTGTVQATDNAGGIFGCVDANGTTTLQSTQLMNYMGGNVSGANAGGVMGLLTKSPEAPSADVSITNSIVAMHGSVDQPVAGSSDFSPSSLEVVVERNFGMVCSSEPSAAAPNPVLTGFTTHPSFTDLVYVEMSGTDPDGFEQKFDFLFANLGGHPVYKDVWTHLSLHTAEVSAPFPTDYGLDAATNTTVYRTYTDLVSNSIFVDDALTILQTEADVAYNYNKSAVILGSATLPLVCEPRALTIEASIDLSLDAGLNAHLTHQATSADAREIVTNAEIASGTSTQLITGLEPETLYMIRLYVDDAMVFKALVTTETNSAENYRATDFYVTEEELYDISKIGDRMPAAVVNDIFATGDIVEVDMGFARKTTMETTFVKKGELVEIDQLEAVLLPFDPSATESQESTIKLSDNTSVQVSLAQGSSNISVGGTTYPSGRSFILDGKKCTVWDI